MGALLHSHFYQLWQDSPWDSVWHVRAWAVRRSASLNASAASLHGMVALNCQLSERVGWLLSLVWEEKGIATELLCLEISA